MYVSLSCLMLMFACAFVCYLIKEVNCFIRYGSIGAKTTIQRLCIFGFMSFAISVGGTKPGYDNGRTCTIELYSNSGSEEVLAIKLEYDKVYNLPENPFTAPKGKRFAGWQGSNGRRYDDRISVFYPVNVGENFKLIAIWE